MDVLLINHKFPPDQGVATFRVAKFAKYLSDFGCNVYVLTRKNQGNQNNSHINVLESIEYIERVKMLSDMVLKATDIRWTFPLIKKTIELINDQDIDIVLHSGPQFLPFGACIPVRRLAGVPYILDLRDPWRLFDSSQSEGLKNRIYHELHDHLEPRVFQCASAIVLNNQRAKSLYAKKYPSLAGKMYFINNGFDPEDFEDIEPAESEGFEIVFPGKFRDDMRWFFEQFAKLVDTNSDIFFTHFGREDRDSVIKVKSVVEDLGLESHVSFEGYVDRNEVFSATMGADLGLAVGIPGDEARIHTKIYDYMGCNVPILAVDDGVSAMRDMLREFPNAMVVKRSDESEVFDALAFMYENQPTGLGDLDATKEYTRRSLTQKMYNLMEAQLD